MYSQKVAGRKVMGEGMRPGRWWEDKKNVYSVYDRLEFVFMYDTM